MPWFEEERYFASEERYYTKLNHKFVARGFKRPPDTIRAETRRKYKNCRETKREEKRTQERFEQLFIPKDDTPSRASPVVISSFSRSKVEGTGTTATTTTTSQTTTTGTSQETKSASPPNRYLSVNQERDYQDALRQNTNSVLPAAGISVQQMLDMLNRELTPEDYELLLRLDETVEKKTVNQETLTTLKQTTIDREEHLSEVCTVCMFSYEMGDPVKYLPCNHFFHVDCIVPYLSSYGQSCPVCKAKVT
jgi:hypothetical protein